MSVDFLLNLFVASCRRAFFFSLPACFQDTRVGDMGSEMLCKNVYTYILYYYLSTCRLLDPARAPCARQDVYSPLGAS